MKQKKHNNHETPATTNKTENRTSNRQNIYINSIGTEHDSQYVVHEKKLQKYKRGEQHIEYCEDSSYISISNPSLRDVLVEKKEEDEYSLGTTFDFDQMRRCFERYQVVANMQGVDILPDTLEIFKQVFKLLTINDNEIAEKMCDFILLIDDTYARRFIEHVHSNNPNSGILTAVKSKCRDYLVRQIKTILEFHRIYVNALLENREEADNLLQLLGLSHYLMKVSVEDFNILALACIKLLLHLDIFNEENIIHAVGYFYTTTNYIRETMDEYYTYSERLGQHTEREERVQSFKNNDHSILDEHMALILSKGGSENLWARKNYRDMKDWYLIQEEICHTVDNRNPLAAEPLLYGESLHGELSTDNSLNKIIRTATTFESEKEEEQEKWFLTWLKKGYKFRKNDKIVYREYHF